MPSRRSHLLVACAAALALTADGLSMSTPVPAAAPAHAPMPSSVLVAGATGRTGRLVVKKLLAEPGAKRVRALVRDAGKAEEALDTGNAKLEVVMCDLGRKNAVAKACEGMDSAIW